MAAYRSRCDALLDRALWLARQPWPERRAFVRSRLTRILRGCKPAAPERPVRGWQEEQKDPVFRATLEAVYAYVLEALTYPGRIVLFLGSQGLKRSAYWRQLDWARVAAGGLEVNVGPAGCTDHLMMLRDPPRVRALADLLKPYLERPPRRPR